MYAARRNEGLRRTQCERSVTSVLMLIRGKRPAASMSRYLLDRIEQAPNITIRTSVTVTALHGTSCLQAAPSPNHSTGRHGTVPTARVFVLIGGTPNTEWAADTAIVRHPRGYLMTGPDLLAAGNPPPCWTLSRRPYELETSVPGSFAVGDVHHGSSSGSPWPSAKARWPCTSCIAGSTNRIDPGDSAGRAGEG